MFLTDDHNPKTRSNLRKLLSDTHVEMAEYGTFETLQTFMDNDIQSEKEEHQLIRDSILNDKKLKVLQARLDGETKEKRSLLKQLDDEIFDLETRAQETKVENDVKSRLVQKWEATRHEQAQFVIENKENGLLNSSKKTRDDIDRELRLKSEIDGLSWNSVIILIFFLNMILSLQFTSTTVSIRSTTRSRSGRTSTSGR